MTPEQVQTETTLLIAIGKAFSEQSTFLTGLLAREHKQMFNATVNQVDNFIKLFESRQTEEAREYLQGVTDVYHNINIEIKKEALKQLKKTA